MNNSQLVANDNDVYWAKIIEELKKVTNGRKKSSANREFIFIQDHIKDIDEIRDGFQGDVFHHLVRGGKIRSRDENRAFSILHDDHRQGLHLIATDSQSRDLWVEGLRHLTTRHGQKRQGDLIREEKWILNYFYLADKDRSNVLTKKECRNLLAKSFHVELPEKVFDRVFHQADRSSGGTLTSDEFVEFFHLLTRRRDLYEVMKENVRQGEKFSMENILMNKNELLTFLRDVQRMKTIVRVEQVENLIKKFEFDPNLRNENKLSLDGFRSLLLSEEFDLVNTYATTNVYQDMTRPLCDYFINTSHNTYLFYSQITGDSSPEAYNRVLLSGGRAVELDCYDGDDGEPVVYHAFTLVKPCRFESIIRAIEKNLFKTSPYPVILNIENHCSAPQQKRMAKILKSILEEKLVSEVLPGHDPSVLPSPEDLKYKVLIRSKKISVTSELAKIRLENEDDDDSPFDPLSKKIQPDLAELFVYLQNVPFKENSEAKILYSPFHSSSLAENHFFKIIEKTPVDLVQQTSWRLIRTYPDGFRQDSSNQNPIFPWISGVQMVALNFQNNDEAMLLAAGKFIDNGGCGYVLKPDYLIRSSQTQFNPFDPSDSDFDVPRFLTVRILSGQFLNRIDENSSDIPDPYVTISVHGLQCDTAKCQTKSVRNNAFDPMWNETFEFRIDFPQLTLISFSVYDHDDFSGDDRIASFCLPMTLMRPGYRHIHLRATNNDKTHSTLFVFIEINDVDQSNIISTQL